MDPTSEETQLYCGPDEVLVVSECPCGKRHYATVELGDCVCIPRLKLPEPEVES